jgi:uncharacterized protein
MEAAIENFIKCKRIAVVGVSRDQKKFGSAIYADLKTRGYQVFAVNPSTAEIAGDPCYSSLSVLKDKIDAAVICVKPAQASAVLQDAAQIGLQNIWLQQGSESPEVLKTAHDLGLNPITKKCILMYAPPVQSIHNWHRFFAKLFGQL